jgi:hypothetical protein
MDRYYQCHKDFDLWQTLNKNNPKKQKKDYAYAKT